MLFRDGIEVEGHSRNFKWFCVWHERQIAKVVKDQNEQKSEKTGKVKW